MTTVGIIGAGHIGSALAQGLVDRGYDVVIANSRDPQTLDGLVAELGPHARAATAADAAAAAEWAIVTVPLRVLPDIPVAPLAGKVVLDTNNYYPQRDGRIAALDDKRTTSSALLQEHLPTSKVVKAFNAIRSTEILTDGSPAGTPDRRALAISTDDDAARELATGVLDELGYDVVDLGPLADSWRIEPGTPGYGARRTAAELRTDLAAAER